MAFPWMGATSLVLCMEMRVIGWNSDFHSYPSWCWSAMVRSRLLSCSHILYQEQLARGCGCFGWWFSGILWQQQKKLGSHVRKVRFTLACTARVNPGSLGGNISSSRLLRGPRKKRTFSGRRVLPLYAEVLVPDPSGKGSVWLCVCQKDKETMRTQHKLKVTRWFDLTIFDYYSQLMWKCSAMMLCPVLGCGKVASFDG